MDWASIPTWVWILVVVAALVVAPIKLRIFKSLLKKRGSAPDSE